jgi:hypothetical protein
MKCLYFLTCAISSSRESAGRWRWIIAWQFEQTGIKSLTGARPSHHRAFREGFGPDYSRTSRGESPANDYHTRIVRTVPSLAWSSPIAVSFDLLRAFYYWRPIIAPAWQRSLQASPPRTNSAAGFPVTRSRKRENEDTARNLAVESQRRAIKIASR